MPRKLKTAKIKIRGGAVTEQQWQNFIKTHNLMKYQPKTPAEIQEYKDMVAYQQADIHESESYKNTNPIAYNNWQGRYTEGYNKAVDEFGNDPDKLWSDAHSLPYKQLDYHVAGYVDASAYPEDVKYRYDGYEWGYDDALQMLWKTIPKPQDKDWTDYFVQGVTLPFTIANSSL